jgi:hypothetical protein
VADESVEEIPVAGDVVRPKRTAATILDMVRSLGVMLVVVALTLIFVPGLLHPSKSQRFAPVGYADYVAGFQQVTGLRALVPTGLATPWYANSATLHHSGKEAHLHIGWVTPTNDYAALEESNGATKTFIRGVIGARGLQVTSQVQVAGATWARSVSDSGEQSLTRTTLGVTIVITGSASVVQQERLAATLTPAA